MVLPRAAHGSAASDFRPFPPLPAWSAIFLLFALLEEIGWRGYLQPRAIQLFGLRRGLFLVALIWAAFHLPLDIYGSQSFYLPLTILRRFVATGIYSAVLSWLVLRSRSVWPAAVAHGLYNISRQGAQATVRFEYPWLGYTGIALWAVAAYWLFKRYPPALPPDPGAA